MADRRTSKRKSDAEPKASTAKRARGGSSSSLADSIAESHDDATQTTNLDAHGAEIHWEWENEEEVITRTTITEERIIALRSKIISTPIQRSVLAVSHIYTHGRSLQDGDIGRLVNADEDEVLEVHSDEESEISTPRRRLYQRSSTSGVKSAKHDSISTRRTSRATGADDETTSELQSSTSRSSRRSTANAAVVAPTTTGTGGVASRRSTSSAATTAALTLAAPTATPSGRGGRRASRASTVLDSAPSTPRSTRSSRANSPAHSPARSVSSIATGRGSTASTSKRVATRGKNKVSAAASAATEPLAPMVLAFNRQNQQANQQQEDNNANNDDNNEGNNDYNDYNEPVDAIPVVPVRTEEEEVSWISHIARVIKYTLLHYTKPLVAAAVVMFVCFAVVYLRSHSAARTAVSSAPKVSNTTQFNFTVTTERPTPTADPAIAVLKSQLDAQREKLLQVNDLVQNSSAHWQSVVEQTEAQVSTEMRSVHNQTLEAINSLAEDVTLLDTHLGGLATTAHRNMAELERNLTSLHSLGEAQNAQFDAQLQELAPSVANLTLQAQELDTLVNAGVQVLQEVIHSFPHFDATSAASIVAGDVGNEMLTMENVISLAKDTVEHISAARTAQEHTNTILNEQADTLTKTIGQAEVDLATTHAVYHTTQEAYQAQVDEALQDIDNKQAESVLLAQESLVVAAAAVRAANDEQRARMYRLAQHAAQEQEAQRLLELEEEANQVHPLNSAEAEQLVQSVAEPVLSEKLPVLFTKHQQQVDAEMDRVFNQEMLHQQSEMDKTLESPAVKQVVQKIVSAQPDTVTNTHSASPTTSSSSTSATATTSSTTSAAASPDHLPGQTDDPLLPHNYAYGPRGGKVVHPRRFTPISPKNSMDKRLTSPAYTAASHSGIAGFLSGASVFGGKHSGNKQYADLPRVVAPQCVVSHLRPTLTDFYPLPMDGVMSEAVQKYRAQSGAGQSVPQITVELHARVLVQSVKLVHAAKNRSYEDPISSDVDSLSDSMSDGSGDAHIDAHREGDVQPCAPERVRFIGWTLNPFHTDSVSVDLGTYRFDSYTSSNDYALSDSSTANVSVYEQVFDIASYVRTHHSDLMSENAVGPALKAVTLQVLSNHGEAKFTCVHRLQVVGVLEDVNA